jgi:hypothetical protein
MLAFICLVELRSYRRTFSGRSAETSLVAVSRESNSVNRSGREPPTGASGRDSSAELRFSFVISPA